MYNYLFYLCSSSRTLSLSGDEVQYPALYYLHLHLQTPVCQMQLLLKLSLSSLSLTISLIMYIAPPSQVTIINFTCLLLLLEPEYPGDTSTQEGTVYYIYFFILEFRLALRSLKLLRTELKYHQSTVSLESIISENVLQP